MARMALLGCLLVGWFFTGSLSQIISLRTNTVVNKTWFEVGWIQVSSEWMTVSSTQKFRDPVVFLSTPFSLRGQDFLHPLEARMSNLRIVQDHISFQVKLISPNDSYCSKQWWIPVSYPGSLNLSWVAFEKGGYSLNDTQMVVGASEISGYVTKVDWEFPFGTICHYPTQSGDDDYSPGGIFELQTVRNPGAYLSGRTTQWWFKGEANKCSYAWSTGRFFLEPHEGYPSEEKVLLQTESLGYLLFTPSPHVIDCLEGSVFEFGTLHSLTDIPSSLILNHPVNTIPGIYASVNGYTGGDSFVLRSFSESGSLSPYIYLQEDQCSDQEMVHLPESASLLVISPASSHCPQSPVLSQFSEAPTFSPSDSPSHHPSSFITTPTQVPTEVLATGNPKRNSNKSSDLLLAIVLPIIILAVIAIVGLAVRAYLMGGKGELIPLSEHSGNNLIFDT